jgi:hypothetical protein
MQTGRRIKIKGIGIEETPYNKYINSKKGDQIHQKQLSGSLDER